MKINTTRYLQKVKKIYNEQVTDMKLKVHQKMYHCKSTDYHNCDKQEPCQFFSRSDGFQLL